MSFIGRTLFRKGAQKATSYVSSSRSGSAARCWSTVATVNRSSRHSRNNDDVTMKNSKQSKQQSSFSSVTSHEVGKFSAMHHEWWDADKNPLIGMNAVRMRYIQDQVVKYNNSCNDTMATGAHAFPLPFDGLKALDIGCGGGVACESLYRLGAKQVTGLDPSPDLIAAARQHADETSLTTSNSSNNNTLEYKSMSVEDFLAQHQNADGKVDEDQYFDVICCLEVIEHVPELHSLLTATSKLLHPERGLLFVSTMSPTLPAYALTIVAAEYIMGYLPVGTHDWNLYRSPDQVQQVMTAAGTDLQQVNATGMVLSGPPPILGMGSWHWTLDPNYTDVNWIGTYRRSSSSSTSQTE